MQNIRYFLFLSLPLAILLILGIGIVVYIISGGLIVEQEILFVILFNSITARPQILVLFLLVLVVVWFLQWYLFKEKILANMVELKKYKQILDEQERAAQLLVRRDLELTNANDRLHKLDEVKTSFISVVAHQLRTPLSGIKWTLNLILNGDVGALAMEQRTFLMKAYESNDRMISLVNDMLGADRIDSGKARPVFQSVSIADVADNVLFELLPQANAKGLTMKFDTRPAEALKVRADPERLRAVFQNLLENAIKYSRPQGTIEVGIEKKGEEAQVFVKDDGIGIPKEQQKNIFERFFRAKNAVKLETEGSGLGLFIVRSIVERHGGRIWFSSEEGKGVLFNFTIPLVRDGEGLAEDPVPSSVSGL